MIMALTIAVLVFGGVFLMQQRGMVRMVLGMQLIGHSANLMLLAAGVGAWRGEVFPDRTDLAADAADPLPQAFVLTAIVIAMATATILLALAALGKNDHTELTDPLSHRENGDTELHDSPMSTLGRATQSRDEFIAGEQARRAAEQAQTELKEGGR